MLEAVLRHINNWFAQATLRRTWHVSGGSIDAPDGFLADGQWLRVQGSTFNDGLHRWPCSDMADEEFCGAVSALAVPEAVVDLSSEIEVWCEEHGGEGRSPYASESFGGYSYSKASDGSDAWQGAFRRDLNRWRKL